MGESRSSGHGPLLPFVYGVAFVCVQSEDMSFYGMALVQSEDAVVYGVAFCCDQSEDAIVNALAFVVFRVKTVW